MSQRIPDCDLAVCFVGRGTHFHAVRLTDGVPGDRPICGSGPKGTEVRVPWDHTGNAYEDAWGEYAVDCPKCLRWMYPEANVSGLDRAALAEARSQGLTATHIDLPKSRGTLGAYPHPDHNPYLHDPVAGAMMDAHRDIPLGGSDDH